MPKTYKVRFMPLAIQDMADIVDYIADVLCTPQAAYDLLTKIDEAVEPLERFPFAFALYRDEAFAKLGYRVLPVDHYLLFYVVCGDAVEIRRVVYAKRDLPEALDPEDEDR